MRKCRCNIQAPAPVGGATFEDLMQEFMKRMNMYSRLKANASTDAGKYVRMYIVSQYISKYMDSVAQPVAQAEAA